MVIDWSYPILNHYYYMRTHISLNECVESCVGVAEAGLLMVKVIIIVAPWKVVGVLFWRKWIWVGVYTVSVHMCTVRLFFYLFFFDTRFVSTQLCTLDYVHVYIWIKCNVHFRESLQFLSAHSFIVRLMCIVGFESHCVESFRSQWRN